MAALLFGATFVGIDNISAYGMGMMGYQGNEVLVAETEVRWDVTRRWSLVGFTGAGRATRDLGNLPKLFEERDEAQNAWNAGGGVRYRIARGPEDWAFYITVGSGWNRM